MSTLPNPDTDVPGDSPEPAADNAPLGPSGKPMTLSDTDEDLLVHGRIGYGTRTPWLLGAALVVVIVVLGIVGYLRQNDDPGSQQDRVAPEFSLPLFDGTTFSLAEHRGSVVVVNFWASWCEPCRKEMPAMQQVHADNPDVVFVGVGAKTDKDAPAREFATEYGVTYGLGRDTVGGDAANGGIQQAFGVIGFPSTFIIDPEGHISAVIMAPFESAADLQPYIDDARS